MKAIRTRASFVDSVSVSPSPSPSPPACRYVSAVAGSSRALASDSSATTSKGDQGEGGDKTLRVRRRHSPMTLRPQSRSPISPTFSPAVSNNEHEEYRVARWGHVWDQRTLTDSHRVGHGIGRKADGRGADAVFDDGQRLSSHPMATTPSPSRYSSYRNLASNTSAYSQSRTITTSSLHRAQVAVRHTYEDENPPYQPPPSPAGPSSPSSRSIRSPRISEDLSVPLSIRRLAHASEYADDFDFRASLADEPGDAGQDDVGWYGDRHASILETDMPAMPPDFMEKALKKLQLYQGVSGAEAGGEESLDALTREDILAIGAKVVRPELSERVTRDTSRVAQEEGTELQALRPRRTKLPPLPLPQEIADDQARYDWRAIAPSRGVRKKAKKWYPEVHNSRRKAQARGELARKLDPRPLDEEASRHVDHFTLLLEAELAEIRMQHAYRLTEWTEKRLKDDGYMLDEMTATLHRPFRAPDRPQYIYEFRKIDQSRRAKVEMSKHGFKQGTCVEISRLHPQIDYIDDTGKPVQVVNDEQLLRQYQRERDGHAFELPAYDPEERLYGTVYYQNDAYIRVAFQTPIGGIDQGHWRLDVAYNDFIIRRQIEKLQALYLDPVAQEIGDAEEYGVAPTKVPSLKGNIVEDLDATASKKRMRLVLPEQTIFEGSALRDLLLRGFQQTYIPYTASALDEDIHHGDGEGVVTVMEAPVPAAAGTSSPDDVNASQIASNGSTRRSSMLMRHPGLSDWVERHRGGGKAAHRGGDPEMSLNESQTRAIAMMLGERLSLVQGPPGTGKTRTIIEAIKLLKLHWKLPHPTLVTAHTNAAVDNLAAGLHQHGLKVVRIGAPERIRADVAGLSLESLMEKHPMYADMEKGREAVKSLQLTINECGKIIDGWRKNGDAKSYASEFALEQAKANRLEALDKINREKEKIKSRQALVRKEVLVDADAICATCLSSVKADLDVIDFPIVFLDEASMATEPLSWLPLSKGAMHVAIIGDHKQLPPVITSSAAHLGGLSTSLFERLIREKDIPSIMLDTQYRMHPQISSFPNQAFYAGALQDGRVDASGQAPDDLSQPETYWLKKDADGRRLNFTFVDTDAPETPRNLSIANEREADLVCDIVSDLLAENPTLRGADIGVITPYMAQINLLEQYLGSGDEIRAKQFEEYLGADRAKELADIEIKTVDGFEGREKDVIIFSTVRSNERGYIGFLADWRRLNVGLTRAKRGLIMLGSHKTLSKARIGRQAQETLPQGGTEVWKKLMRHIKEEDMILQVDVPDEADD